MRTCPGCLEEYEDWVTRCPDCGTSLTGDTGSVAPAQRRRPDELIGDPHLRGELQAIFQSDALDDIVRLAGVLKGAGIPYGYSEPEEEGIDDDAPVQGALYVSGVWATEALAVLGPELARLRDDDAISRRLDDLFGDEVERPELAERRGFQEQDDGSIMVIDPDEEEPTDTTTITGG